MNESLHSSHGGELWSAALAQDRFVCKFWVESPMSVEQAAEVLAGQLSTGTFVAVPGETEDLLARFRARVEQVTPLDIVDAPSLPGSRVPGGAPTPVRYRRAEVVVSFPFENVGANLPTLISIVAGDLNALCQFSGLRLLDLIIPPAFAEFYPGPQFGIEGTRRLTGVFGRPIIGTVIKPNLGLTPQQTAEFVRTMAEAGVDFVKDDEKLGNPPHSPLAERVAAVMPVINEFAGRTGKKVMYAFNVTDRLDAMLRHHDTVVKSGGTCVMVSINTVGIAGVAALRAHSQVPIHAHRNMWSTFMRCPALGMDFKVSQKIWRIAGVDQLHVNGLGNKFWEPDDSVVKSIQACLAPLWHGYHVMPVVSSAQWGGQAPETYRRTGTTDVMYVAGGGIMAHPGGPGGGVRAIQQAWEAAVQQIQLETYAQSHTELRQAIEKFGKRGAKA